MSWYFKDRQGDCKFHNALKVLSDKLWQKNYKVLCEFYDLVIIELDFNKKTESFLVNEELLG